MPSRPDDRRRVIWAAVIVIGVALWWVNFAMSAAAEDNPDLRKAYAFIFMFRALVSAGLLALAYRLMWRAVGPYSAPDGAAQMSASEQLRHPGFADPSASGPAAGHGSRAPGDRDPDAPLTHRHPAFEQPHGDPPPRRDRF